MRRVNSVALPINDLSARRAGWTKHTPSREEILECFAQFFIKCFPDI
jgi:hypothetical protein